MNAELSLWLFLGGFVLILLALVIEHRPRTTPSRVTPWMMYPRQWRSPLPGSAAQCRVDPAMTAPAPPLRVFLLGTNPEADVVVVDEFASAEHAVVWLDTAGQSWVRDMGSTNGTLVRLPSGQETMLTLWRPGPLRITPGCSIRVGRTWIPWTARIVNRES